MKRTIILSDLRPANDTRTAKKSIWAILSTLYNSMPLGITPCRTEKEAKTYTFLLAVVLLAFVAAGIYDTLLMKGGGI